MVKKFKKNMIYTKRQMRQKEGLETVAVVLPWYIPVF